MKKVFRSAAVLGFALSIAMSSCKKKEEVEADEFSTQQTTVTDNSAGMESADDVADDASAAYDQDLSNSSRVEKVVLGKDTLNVAKIKDGVVVKDLQTGVITITYAGTNLNDRGRKKQGVVKISKTGTWGVEGTTHTITFENLKVTRESDNKSVTLNGTKTITNLSSGKFGDILAGKPFNQKVRGTLSLTFDDASVRSWTITRKRITAIEKGMTALKIVGDTTINGVSGIAETGSTRGNYAFTHSIVDTIIFRGCGLRPRLVAGKELHKISSDNYPAGKEITIEAGLDAAGNKPTTECEATSVKISWTNKRNVPKTAIVRVVK